MNRLSERGQPCPHESSPRHSRTRLSALLSVAGSWSRCVILKSWRLPMNRSPASRPSPPVGEKVPGSSAVGLAKAEGRLRGIPTGSWPRFTSKFWRFPISMNRLPVAASRQRAAGCCSHELRRSAETPLRQGSWPQRALAKSWEPPMNRRAALPSEILGRSCWNSRPCLFLVAGLALGLCGCAGYRLGPANPGLTRGKTVQVNFFGNRTLEPRLVEAVNHALRKSLQQDGTYKLNTRGDGDIIVNGAILRYERQGVSFQPNDILTVRDYQVTLMVKVTATERATGKVVLDREVTGRTTVRVGSDLPSAERQALPLLADDLARNATTLLTEGTW